MYSLFDFKPDDIFCERIVYPHIIIDVAIMATYNKNMNEDEYQCLKCNDIWEIFPEDYDFIEENYPNICPLCSMPISEMFKDIYQVEGLWEAIKTTFKRLTNSL